MRWCREFNLALSSINTWRNGVHVVSGGAQIVGKRFENIKAAVEELKQQGFDPKNWSLSEIDKNIFKRSIDSKMPHAEEYSNLLEIDCCLNALEKFLKGESCLDK